MNLWRSLDTAERVVLIGALLALLGALAIRVVL